ncbi:MAG: hypothetical protein L3K26_05570 [Candidatus Hydrogenedentes bacterium]|nr:hypothetical protein [Candidatus Hydrogenedentota bacterium]
MLDALIQTSRNTLVIPLVLLAAASLGVAFYLAVVLIRREKKADQRLKQARADITDMTILFQTMRDIIGQQKKLAREFNDELEHKMGQVKHILNQGMEKNKQLYEKQQRIVTDLHEAQAQIDGIYRQIGHARDGAPLPLRHAAQKVLTEPARVDDVIPNTTPARAKPQKFADAQERMGNGMPSPAVRDILRKAKPPLQRQPEPQAPTAAPEKLADTGVTGASFTSWVAEDLTPNTPQPPPPEPALGTEAAPRNGDAAREAFRALLNMPSEENKPQATLDLTGQMPAMAGAILSEAPEPDMHSTSAMQQRVLEYSEAGMTVADISRELGIGKGEVRLMLSLAKQNTRPKV